MTPAMKSGACYLILDFRLSCGMLREQCEVGSTERSQNVSVERF
ncbi:hypothetical protein [Nostoc sp. FACHB-133]|nr:hypothetical protein [Nostoc sp. FACHB-133]